MKSLQFNPETSHSGEFFFLGDGIPQIVPSPTNPPSIGAPRYAGTTPYFPDATPAATPEWQRVIAAIRGMPMVAPVQIGYEALFVNLKEGETWSSATITLIADTMWSAIDADASVMPEKYITLKAANYIKKDIA